MPTNYLTTDTDLTSVANKIRAKGGTSAQLSFPTGFNNAIDALNVGVGLSPAASAADIRTGKKAVVNRTTITGTMQDQAAATYNTSTSDQSIAAGKYLAGAQTIKAVTTSNIDAANIKKGVTVKVGDANSAGRIKDVTGTFTGDANATASDILSPKTAYVNGSKVTGNVPSLGALTYHPSTSAQTISAGRYLSGAQTFSAVTLTNLTAGNIKSGVTVKIGDQTDDDCVASVTGTYTAGTIETTVAFGTSGSHVAGATIPAHGAYLWQVYEPASPPVGYNANNKYFEAPNTTNWPASPYISFGYVKNNGKYFVAVCNFDSYSYTIPSEATLVPGYRYFRAV